MIAEEKKTVELMIKMYCHHKEGNPTLCDSCKALLAYSRARLDRCPDGDRKGSCRLCRRHCYSPAMAELMRDVMRWSGPRMIFHHPLLALRHLAKEKFSR